MELLTKVDSEGIVKFTPQAKDQSKSFSLSEYRILASKLSERIKIGERISDEFLDHQHRNLKKMFKDYYLKSYRTTLKIMEDEITFYDQSNLKKDSISFSDRVKFYLFYREKHGEFRQEMEETISLRDSFNRYLTNNFETIFKDFPGEFRITYGKTNELNQKDTKVVKKSFWRMFFRLTISGIIMFSIVGLILLFLWTPAVTLFMIFSEKNEILKLFSILLLGIPSIAIILYFIILWAAYNAYSVQFYLDSPRVTHDWIYYLTGLFFTGSLIHYIYKSRNEKGSTGNVLINFVAIAYIIFSIWTGLLDYKLFSWFINLIY